MKTMFLSFALLFVCGIAAAQDKDALPARVTVHWAPVSELSEVKKNSFGRGWMKPEEWMQTLGDYLRKRADDILPPGQQLDVTIDDIDLAGDFEPWHGPRAEDIRFMRDRYPPRLDLHYRLTDTSGAVVHEGVRKLRDGAYLQRTVTTSTDPLRYDKRLIADWLLREFKPKS